MHTEEHAKKLWCPFARAAFPAGSIRSRPDLGADMAEQLATTVVGNRPADPGCHCIASECMAWRWSHFTAGHAKHGSDYISDGCPPGKKAEGYCGLAGRSE